MKITRGTIQDNSILLLLLFIGGLLRIFNFWDWSLTNDELSALSRLKFNTFSELIQEGVKPDGHPAFVQVFLYYWTAIFGQSSFALRLPFVLSGILSLVYFYKIGVNTLGKYRALVALSLFCVSQLFILYAQIARPYSVGLLFVLIFYYSWQKFFQNKTSRQNSVLFILSGVLSLLTHYFAGLAVAIILLFGLSRLTIKNWSSYFMLNGAIALFFIPHLSITFYQLSVGGVSWLPEPEGNYVFLFIAFLFNQSDSFLYLLLGILLVGIYFKKHRVFSKQTVHFLLLFLIPYFVIYFYSIHISPLMQFSALIFFAPFILLSIASLLPQSFPVKLLYTLLVLVIVVGIKSLVFSLDFYHEKPFANYKQVAKLSIAYEEKLGSAELLSIANFNSKSHIQYYINQFDTSYRFDVEDASLPEKVLLIQKKLLDPKTKYVMVSFANTPVPHEIHEWIRSYFPQIKLQHRFFNSEVIIYEKGESKRELFFQTTFDEKKTTDNWSIQQDHFQDSVYLTPPLAYRLSSNEEYALTYRNTVGNLFSDQHKFLYISAMLKGTESTSIKLVVSVEREGEIEPVFWRASDYYYSADNWTPVQYVLEKTTKLKNTDQVVIYFWNRNKSTPYIDEFKIMNYTDSDYNYYEF